MNTRIPEPPLLTVADAARIMFPDLDPARARRKLYRWAPALPPEVAFRVGSTIAIRRTALIEWLNQGLGQNGTARDN